MKKLLAILLCGLMLISFVACGSSESENKDTGADDVKTEEKEEASEYDVGDFTVLVPAGWQVVPATEADGSGNKQTDCVYVVKGGDNLYNDPYIQIDYYGPSVTMMTLSSSFGYENVEEIEGVEMGDYTWSGFSATSFDRPLTALQTEAGDHEFQITLWTEQSSGTIALEDEDVQAIIESLTPNA